MTTFDSLFPQTKEELLAENERLYGDETRQKYGQEAVDASYAKLEGLSQAEFTELNNLSAELHETLKTACATGDPAGPEAQQACELHRRWLGFFWQEYSPQAHLLLAEMYLSDERFSAYYERLAPGCASFLYQALSIYCRSC